MAKQSQAQRLLAHLQSGGTITSLEAFNVLGITQLSARIIDLERSGHLINHERITVQNRFGEDVRVVRYSIGEQHGQ